jgi:hypothetical protein
VILLWFYLRNLRNLRINEFSVYIKNLSADYADEYMIQLRLCLRSLVINAFFILSEIGPRMKQIRAVGYVTQF